MQREKAPILRHPDVKGAESDLQEALHTEELVFQYKIKREEQLSIFDEIKKYLTYRRIRESKDFSKLPNGLKKKIEGLAADGGIEKIIDSSAEPVDGKSANLETQVDKDALGQLFASDSVEDFVRGEGQMIADMATGIRKIIDSSAEPVDGKGANLETQADKDALNQPILFADFRNFWQTDKQLFFSVLFDALMKSETEAVVNSDGGKGENRKVIKEEIENRVYGQMMRLGALMEFHFTRLSEELAAFSEDDLTKISSYSRQSRGKAKEALSELDMIKKGIRSHKSSKAADVIRGPEEAAKMHQTSHESASDLKKMMERLIKEKTGKKFEFGVEEKYDKVGNLVAKDFMTAYVNYHREMSEMHQLLNEGKIVETDYIRELIDRALPSLKKDPPTIVYFHGDFGTGKTALAIHIARTRFGKEPIIVSGSKFLEPERFTEEFRIQKMPIRDFLNSIRGEMGLEGKQFDQDTPLEKIVEALAASRADLREKIKENWLKESYINSLSAEQRFKDDDFRQYIADNKDKIPAEKSRDIETEIDSLFKNEVQGQYVLGAMYHARKEGRPLIVDEANAISPDVLIALNDALTKKINERISVRAEEREIVGKQGYCIIWTGNTGERYQQARFDTDPATYSRIHPIRMGYLPQSRETSNINELLGRLELSKISDAAFSDEPEALAYVREKKELAKGDQIFQVMIVRLLNERLGATLLVKEDDPYSVFKDLYRLSMGARIIMDIFEGVSALPTLPNLDKIIGASESITLTKKLRKSNLTMRELMDNILGGYLDEGCNMDIEYYLFNFVRKYDMYPEEQAILYAVLSKVGFFQTSEGWPDYQSVTGDTSEALQSFQEMMKFNPVVSIDKYKQIQQNGESVSLLNTKGEYRLEYFSSIETLQLLFGYLPPRQKKEYESLQKAQQKVFEAKEQGAKRKRVELVETMVAISRSLNTSLFKTSAEVTGLLGQVKSFDFGDPNFVKNSSDDDFFKEVGDFCELFLNFLKESGKISQEDLDKTEELPVEEKLAALNNFMARADKKSEEVN